MIQTLAAPAGASRSPRSTIAPAEAPRSSRHTERDPIAERVLELISEHSVARRFQERRRERRFPYPHAVYLTPLTDEGPLVDETVVAMGKHLSAHGLDFYHREPLPYRRMIASLEVNGRWVGLVLDLKWCRFNSHGLYENGGRLVSLVDSPLAPDEATCVAAATR